jgi:hypothetical protein
MPMVKIGLEDAKRIAEAKSLHPCRVIGTDGIQFAAKGNERVEVITWEEFESLLKSRNLAVFESNGFMKVMKAQG